MLRNENLNLEDKDFIGKMRSQLRINHNVVGWNKEVQNLLLGAEILVETGNQIQSLREVEKVLKEDDGNPNAIFLLTRLTVHLKDK